MSYIGTTKIGKLFLGSVEIAKAYLGSDLVFQKAGGGGGDLPAGAIPCELVYSNGYTDFIETGFTPGASMSYEADIFWVRESGISTPFAYYLSSRRYAPFLIEDGKPYVQFDYWYLGDNTTYPTVKMTRARCSITQTGATVEYRDAEGNLFDSFTVTYNETDFTPSQTLPLLGRKTGASSIAEGSFRGALGRVKFYSDASFTTLAADFIPCYYQGAFGVWEKVAGQFKAGTSSTNILGIGEHWGTQGFFPNTRNSSSASGVDYLTPYRLWLTSRMFELPAGCTAVRFNGGTVQAGDTHGLYVFNSSKQCVTYYNYNTADRVVSIGSNVAYLRLSMTWDKVDDCYLYDVTHQQYIWKGRNVQPGQFLTITKTQVASITPVSAQGAACYGDYLIGFAGPNTTAWLWNLRTSSLVQQISIPASERGFVASCHSNTVNFGTEFYDAGDEFPLVYVSTGYADGSHSGALVYRIVNTGGVYSLTLVQTLKFPGSDWTEFITAGSDCYVMRETASGDQECYKFPMPSLLDGSVVTFDYTQALSYSNFGGKPSWYAGSRTQGGCYYNGRIYYASGVPNSETLLLIQGNPATGIREVEINLAEVSLSIEPESAFIWDGKICLSFWQNSAIYQIEWQ